ncbi:hypothetical protein OSB04_024820 [Centaurea solstitialis]|uniref:Uncharacterized protein n=1 Tax=Centaurea solstitialis TaxID=347529 RepID=A0AA38SMH7_9ASTR|nr:hypothetical protein OSB04_024820 [Centaurea solstitialis]
MILEDTLRKSKDTYEMLQDAQIPARVQSVDCFLEDVCQILFVILNPKGEIVGCKIGLYPRSQVGAQSEDKGKMSYTVVPFYSHEESLKGEIVGCKIGLYPRSQVGAQSEDKGKMSYTVVPFYSHEESLLLIMGKCKLIGQNFPAWKLHLDNVLSAQGKLYVINKPLSRPKSNSLEKEFAEYFKFMADESDVMSILYFSTSSEFTVNLRVKFCHEVMKDIEEQVGFYKNCGKYLIMKDIFSLKLEMGQSVKDLFLKIRRLFKCLSRLG